MVGPGKVFLKYDWITLLPLPPSILFIYLETKSHYIVLASLEVAVWSGLPWMHRRLLPECWGPDWMERHLSHSFSCVDTRQYSHHILLLPFLPSNRVFSQTMSQINSSFLLKLLLLSILSQRKYWGWMCWHIPLISEFRTKEGIMLQASLVYIRSSSQPGLHKKPYIGGRWSFY